MQRRIARYLGRYMHRLLALSCSAAQGDERETESACHPGLLRTGLYFIIITLSDKQRPSRIPSIGANDGDADISVM